MFDEDYVYVTVMLHVTVTLHVTLHISHFTCYMFGDF